MMVLNNSQAAPAYRLLHGFVGLWTRADAVSYFAGLVIEAAGKALQL
jgi:hypothetical protein